jgi:hypothetical protein
MERVDIFLEPARVFLMQVGEFLPKVMLALVIVLAGWLIAKGLKFAVIKALRAVNFNVLTEKSGIDDFLRLSGSEVDTTRIFALLIYWLVILAALMVAFNGMGLAYVTDVLGRIVLFVPKVLVAVLILAFGAYFARFIGTTLTAFFRNVDLADAEILGRLAQYAIMVFVVLIALDQMDLGDIIRQSFLIILSAVALGLALAFGLGGQKRAAELLERWSRRGTAGDDDRQRQR